MNLKIFTMTLKNYNFVQKYLFKNMIIHNF